MATFSDLVSQKSFPDLLPYAILYSNSIILTKNGGLISGVEYSSSDLSSLTTDEINGFSSQLNTVLAGVDDGWSIHVDVVREDSGEYFSEHLSYFPDPITQGIDDDRREYYLKNAQNHHYDSKYYLLVHYLPPKMNESKLRALLVEGGEGVKSLEGRIVSNFIDKFVELCESLKYVFTNVKILTSYRFDDEYGVSHFRNQLVDYLNYCVTGLDHPVDLPLDVCFLDAVVGKKDFVGGFEPRVGDYEVCTVMIDGFPQYSNPSILASLDRIPFRYRWSSRFIFLSSVQARGELKKLRRKWLQKTRGFFDTFFNIPQAVSGEAVSMVADSEGAIDDLDAGVVGYGYYTSGIHLMDKDRVALEENAGVLVNYLAGLGFSARIEKLNAVEAFLGSFIGNDGMNVRKPIIHTMNFADFFPKSSVFDGKHENPSQMFPAGSPPLFLADTEGGSIFRVNLHVNDLGHSLIIGPTGSGKSTLLVFIAAQFRRYKDSKVFCFDKGYSMYTLFKSVPGSQHYDIGLDDSLSFAPLSTSVKMGDKTWFTAWVCSCCELQMKKSLTPAQKGLLGDAVNLVFDACERGEMDKGTLGLSELMSYIQDADLSAAFKHYTTSGGAGYLLDSNEDSLEISNFSCFELEDFMNRPDDDKLPVLEYIFYRLEKSLTGSPSLIILDEAWLMLGHAYFSSRIREWLKTMRKNNCAVILATQSLSDAVNSGILDVIVESTATKIFLPNPSALSDFSKEFYKSFGLNDSQISIIANAVSKRQYYFTSADGSRLIDLALSDDVLKYVGVSGIEQKKKVDNLIKAHGEGWIKYL